jgi:GYF domain 2
MQKHQVAGEAGPRAPSWYLARGDKRYGPLADRELLLLAERGGLRTDDLLWKPGFSSWKPVHAVCDLKTSPEVTSRKIASTQKASPPVVPAQDASYLPDGLSGDAPRQEDVVGALDVSEPRKPGLKAKLYDELRRFLMIFAYLWIVFFVFLVHEWIVLADNHIGFRFYGLAVINALVLSKIMLIAEGLRFGERFDDKPLIIPILYKSVLFSVLLVVAYILEEIALGWFHGKSVAESLPQIGGGGVVGTLCVTALLCIALVPFFAFREIARAIGETEFRSLMLGPAKRARAGKITQGIRAYVTEAATSVS